MTRYLGLRNRDGRDQITNAKLAVAKEVKDAKPRPIGERTEHPVDGDRLGQQFHIRLSDYSVPLWTINSIARGSKAAAACANSKKYEASHATLLGFLKSQRSLIAIE